MTRLRLLAATAGLATTLLAPAAFAQDCGGFTDTPASNQFCDNIQWIKNRGVTRGCNVPGEPLRYCPNEAVNRDFMAAFMNRLGNAVLPVILQVNETKPVVGAPLFDLDIPDFTNPPARNPAATVCKSQPFVVENFPRRAVIKADFSGAAAGPVQMFGIPVISKNGGTSFLDVVTYGMRSSIGPVTPPTPYAWQSMAQTVVVDLDVGQTYIFAYLVERAQEDAVGGGTQDLANWRCSVTIEIFSRTGTPPEPI